MNPELSVLIVEDDPHVLLGCQQALTLEDIPCIGVGSAEEALAQVGDNFAGIVISDIRLPGIDGLELLTRLKQRDRSLPVVLITGHGDISMAVGAMQKGAYDFMEKPFSPERLVDVARRALEQRSLAREVSSLRRQLAERDSLEGRIIGRSPAMQNLRELIANVADTSANVLIEGETGTGKELVARCLHDFSRRHSKQFVALNCGGLPENLLKARSSATKPTPSPAPANAASARSNTPTAARCSSMKWKACRCRCRSNCCAYCRNAPSNGSARTRAWQWIAG